MTDYTQNVFFAPKDALATGDPNKAALGTEIDGELSEISTAIASKENLASKDAVSGYAGLDGTGLLTPSVIPAATETTFGGNELATATEVNTGTDAERLVTPATLKGLLQAGATYAVTFGTLTVSTTATLPAGTTIGGGTPFTANSDVDHDLTTNFVADEHVAHASVSITAGEGLTGGGTIAATRTLDLDVNSLTALAGTDVAAADEAVVYDANAAEHKKIVYRSAGIPVIATTNAAKTPTDDEVNSWHLMTDNTTARNFTVNTGIGEKGNVIAVQQGGSEQVTIAGTATFEAANGLKTAAENSVVFLFCTATDTWTVYGDTTT